MEKDLNDIINSINTKLNDKNRAQNLQQAIKLNQESDNNINKISENQTPVSNTPFRPTHNMIVSDIYLIAPSQLKIISDILAKKLANEMNMRAMSPKYKDILNRVLPEILSFMKKSGKKN